VNQQIKIEAENDLKSTEFENFGAELLKNIWGYHETSKSWYWTSSVLWNCMRDTNGSYAKSKLTHFSAGLCEFTRFFWTSRFRIDIWQLHNAQNNKQHLIACTYTFEFSSGGPDLQQLE
jgi:hypothetical protein